MLQSSPGCLSQSSPVQIKSGKPSPVSRRRLSKKSRPADMSGWTGHIQGNLALRVCEPPCGECAVQRRILSPGGYQGEGISVPHMRAEMGSPWSVSQKRHAKSPRPASSTDARPGAFDFRRLYSSNSRSPAWIRSKGASGSATRRRLWL